MNSRERVKKVLNHEEPDRVPLDLGGSGITGMHVSTVYKLRQALELDKPGTPVKVIDPFQMLGEIGPDLMDALGVDVIGVGGPNTVFGYPQAGEKEWITFDGTPVLVPDDFNTIPEPNGDLYQYPQGDKSASPSGHMPKGGWYFDAIVRQEPIDDDKLSVEDNVEEFTRFSDEDLQYFKTEIEKAYNETDKAILAHFGGTSFGDIAFVPGPSLKHPKGIRDIEEWYISLLTRRDYIYKVFERQCEIALDNLERIHALVGDKVSVIQVSGTDFGTQTSTFLSEGTYRDLFMPFHKLVNDWVHKNTSWKTFIHSCGAIFPLIECFIEAGFDILNPVQCSCPGMEPERLKNHFGDRVVFWGGGIDTQRTLPYGTEEEVIEEVKERIKIFGRGGGFVFTPIHNVQAKSPVENLLAMYNTLKKYGRYPLD